jgi:hypothetical protein
MYSVVWFTGIKQIAIVRPQCGLPLLSVLVVRSKYPSTGSNPLLFRGRDLRLSHGRLQEIYQVLYPWKDAKVFTYPMMRPAFPTHFDPPGPVDIAAVRVIASN